MRHLYLEMEVLEQRIAPGDKFRAVVNTCSISLRPPAR